MEVGEGDTIYNSGIGHLLPVSLPCEKVVRGRILAENVEDMRCFVSPVFRDFSSRFAFPRDFPPRYTSNKHISTL